MEEKDKFMKEAIKEAKKAYAKLEVPIGAVIVKNGKIIARGHNQKEEKADAPANDRKTDSGKKPETCTANSDKVDREIERLKKKLAELEQQLNTETDERKIKQLESELAQVQNELRQKDNDAYRRQHTQFTYS